LEHSRSRLKNLPSPTGFELQSMKNADAAEDLDVIDISTLKKIES